MRAAAAVCLLAAVAGAGHCEEKAVPANGGALPFALVPKAGGEPECANGHFRSFGWERSVAFCGMRDANLEGAPFIGKDASWWITYNDRALFIAMMTSLKPQGESYLAQASANDDPAITKDDHVVVQVAPDSRAGQAGVPFLRLVANPNGAVKAESVEALPGQNLPLDTSKIAVGNYVGPHHVPGNWWILRLRIPIEMLGVKSLDGLTAKVHLAYSTAPLYLSWGGTRANDWDRAPELRFDPKPLAGFRLNGAYPFLFDPARGGLTADVLASFLAGTPENRLRLSLAIRNLASGQPTWEKTLEESKSAGEKWATALRENVTLAKGEPNELVLGARASLPGGEGRELFRNVLPFRPGNAEAREALDGWLALHAKELVAAANFDYVYDPYTDRLDALVATGLNTTLYAGKEAARAEAINAADRLRVRVTDAKGKELAASEGAVSAAKGNSVVQLPSPLPEGDYSVRIELLRGKDVADAGDLPLARRKFEWEKNSIGREKVIIPPWTPLEVSGAEVAMWGRQYRLQATGLPAAMISQGADVLGGPVRLGGVVDGKPFAAGGDAPPAIKLVPGQKFPAGFDRYEQADNTCPEAGKDFPLEPTGGFAADVSADGHLGPLALRVRGRIDYDGAYTVRLTLDPGAKPVSVDALTLTIPIAKSAGLYRFNRLVDMSCLGAIPDGEGILQRSSNLPKHPALTGSFVPVVFAGQYDHGLFWLSETDKGWSVDDGDDQVRLVREKGELALQMRIVARPTTFDKPRTYEFALVATPTRPPAPGYRRAFFEGKRVHDTAGFRFYGEGPNGFALYEQKDYEALRKFIYELGSAPHYRDKGDAPAGYNLQYKLRSEILAKEAVPVTLYGCTFGATTGMKEYPTFGSVWTHGTRNGSEAKEFLNMYNFGGTVKWSRPEQIRHVVTLMGDSFVDAWLWHMTRISRFSGVNGCFYDTWEPLPRAMRGRAKTDIDGVAYRREDGQLRPYANPLRYRERVRRYATALWLMGRPPAMLQSNNFENSYGPTWFVEGEIYHKNIGDTLLTMGVTPDKAAAYTASLSGMGMCRSDVRTTGAVELNEQEEHAFRIVNAYMLFFDLAWGGGPDYFSKTTKKIRAALSETIKIADPDVRHIRYWNNGGAVGVSDRALLAGGYVHPKGDAALIAVMNPTRDDRKATVSVAESLLGRPAVSVTDALTGDSLADPRNPALALPAGDVKFLLIR